MALSPSDSQLYQPLRENEIRLLLLQYEYWPAIHYELEVWDFEEIIDNGNYKALSYCWTREPPTRTIHLNGHVVRVRPNLYNYLEVDGNNYRDGSPRYLFVDALCINQNDMAERSHQVRLMGRIYRDAELVVAWLGTEPSTESALWEPENVEEADNILPILQTYCSTLR